MTPSVILIAVTKRRDSVGYRAEIRTHETVIQNTEHSTSLPPSSKNTSKLMCITCTLHIGLVKVLLKSYKAVTWPMENLTNL